MKYTEYLKENRKQATLMLFSELLEGKDFSDTVDNTLEVYRRNNRIIVRSDGLLEVLD